MASAQSKSSGSRPTPPASRTRTGERLPVRRKLLPITIFLAALIGVSALGVMVLALSGVWPPVTGSDVKPNATVVAIRQAGLTIEKVGAPRRRGDQIIATVKVTNNYRATFIPTGVTPVATDPTPQARDLDVKYASIVVFYYGEKTGNEPRPVLGRADGQILDLPFGQSKTVEVIGIGIPDYKEWEPEITSVQPEDK